MQMTRNRLLRLVAKDWWLTQKLYYALYHSPSAYYEVSFIRERSLLDGDNYCDE